MTAISADLIKPFYAALTLPAHQDTRALIESVTTPDWISIGGDALPPKPREAFIQQVMGFGRLIPDLRWEIQDVLVAGDRLIVRSRATGTPTGAFFGVPYGGRSFDIMAIDIHTVEAGRLVKVHHVEDWATALRQLA
ncbi:ester cyclase [Myxococcota bacterium]|nr:ester cyclase [Myxococcota bacterium]MBU1430936.1 ester cyclase [Myxococcota bacterium]MBU1899533.1 ester cyclase [Myxococcota bacterium]